jgi:hypothetical protein
MNKFNTSYPAPFTELRISSNQGRKHFTIVKNGTRYRTNRLSRDEFEEMEMNTPKDWLNFLASSQNYFKVEVDSRWNYR